MGINQRQASRAAKRLQVRYGIDDLDTHSFTKDISTGGVFIVARKLLAIGTQIHMRLEWPTGCFYVEGLVVRHKAVHLELRKIDDQGMGIRFLHPAEVVERVVPLSLRKDGQIIVDCPNKEHVKQLIQDQLSHGLLFVRIGDPPPDIDTPVTFRLVLVFRVKQIPIVGEGRVMQILEPDGKQRRDRAGAVIQIANKESLIHQLEETIQND
ncbi:MAG: PilZ domain-containing protein [Myxococcales bacterium]|nr:MAG: PilZ domain-containing protein [Myxococcales bacterium]